MLVLYLLGRHLEAVTTVNLRMKVSSVLYIVTFWVFLISISEARCPTIPTKIKPERHARVQAHRSEAIGNAVRDNARAPTTAGPRSDSIFIS